MEPYVSVPRRLPCLLLTGQVLLPTGFAKLSWPAEGRRKRTTSLLEYLGSTDKEVWVAILPETNSIKEDAQDVEGSAVGPIPADKIGSIATAARVLQLSRIVQLDDVIPAADPEQDFDCVDITQLELRPPTAGPLQLKHGHTATGGTAQASLSTSSHSSGANSTGYGYTGGDASPAAGSGYSSGSSDVALAELGKQLKATTRALLRQLAHSMGGAQPSKRVLELLNVVPAWRAADVVAAALSSNFQERLSVLRAVDHKQRVRLALGVAQAALDAMQGNGHGGTGGQTTGRAKAARNTGQGFFADVAARSGDSAAAADDDDPDGLDELMARLAAAKPPPEVEKAAAKEYRRLRQSGEHQPGYAAARAYLETLADLPWSRTAADLAAEERAAAASATAPPSSTNGASSNSHSGQVQTQASGSSAVVPRSTGTRSSHGTYGHIVAQGPRFGRTSTPASSNDHHQQPSNSNDSKGPPAVAAEQQGGTAPAHVHHVPAGVPLSLRAARELLDKQHYGLDKIKDRVVEYLAVLRLKGSSTRAPILCFIGPPGVGKTSLARSVAEVLGRPFVRIALGGVRDEAEVRGHRRTYVAAMPGRIVAGLRRARCCDPVMLLDELDKLGKDSVRGDPSAALLEVLDPEQNSAFVDAYLGLPCDLSRVTFVATANRAQDIPAPLLDRLEVVSLSGYTLEEKVHIARVHLVPKALTDHGLGPGMVHFTDPVLEFIAERYTREAGVRNLTRNLAAVCRHVAVSIVSEHEAAVLPRPDTISNGSSIAVPLQQQVMLSSAIGNVQAGDATPRLAASHQGACHVGACSSGGSMYGVTEAALTQQQQGNQQQHGRQHHPDAGAGGRDLQGGPVLWQESGCAASELSSALRDNMSLAGLSEAPLDRFWASSGRHDSMQSGTAPHGTGKAARNSTKASSQQRPGIVSRVLRSSHAKQPTGLEPTAASGPTTTHTSSSRPVGSTSWLFTWGSNSSNAHMSSKADAAMDRPVASTTNQPASSSKFNQSKRSADPAAPRAVSAPSVAYHGMPQALPYPPDLLQQHGAVTVTEELVEQVLGPPRYDGAGEWGPEAVSLPGAAAGLVWTSVGGSVQYIECARISYGSPGRPGTLTLTGQVGEVLEESARIALSWIRAHAVELGLACSASPTQLLDMTCVADGIADSSDELAGGLLAGPVQARRRAKARNTKDSRRDATCSSIKRVNTSAAFRSHSGQVEVMQGGQQEQAAADADEEPITKTSTRVVSTPVATIAAGSLALSRSPALIWDMHVHLPAGAIPKDGPSAGITLGVALVSLLSGKAVRADTAMTGELTLRGLVLPVGGIKEKLLAARHAGLRRVLVPARNMRDVVAEVQQAVRATLTIIPVERFEQVLAAAFDPPYVMQPPPTMQARL